MLNKWFILSGAALVVARSHESAKAAAFASTRTPTACTADEIRKDFEQDIQGELYLVKEAKAKKSILKAVDLCLKKDIDKTKNYQKALMHGIESLEAPEKWYDKEDTVKQEIDRLVHRDKDVVVQLRMSPEETWDFERECKARQGGKPVYFYHGSRSAARIWEFDLSRALIGHLGRGVYMTSHVSKAVEFCRGCQKAPHYSDRGILRVLVCLTNDSVLPVEQDVKSSYRRERESVLNAESKHKQYKFEFDKNPRGVYVRGTSGEPHHITEEDLTKSGVRFFHLFHHSEHRGGEWTARNGNHVKIQALITWRKKTQGSLQVFSYNVAHESMGSKAPAVDCVKANKETGQDSFCKRNIMGVILLQISDGVHFIALQEDSDITVDALESIKNKWNFATQSMDDFLKTYAVPLNSFKTDLDDGNRKKNWTPDVYRSLGKNIKNYKFSKGDLPSSGISSAYNENYLKEVERSRILHFIEAHPRGGPERPFQMHVFKYDPTGNKDFSTLSSAKTVLLINAHGPHVNAETQEYAFPTKKYSDYFTIGKMAKALPKTYGSTERISVDMVVMAGDLAREVKSNEIKVALPRARCSLRKIASLQTATNGKATYVGFDYFKNLRTKTTGLNEQTSLNIYSDKTWKTRDNILVWVANNNRRRTDTTERFDGYIVPTVGPASDHLPVKAILEF